MEKGKWNAIESGKRTTSSAGQPLPGIPLPDRNRKRRDCEAVASSRTSNDDSWSAELRQVKFGQASQYNNRKGLNAVYEKGSSNERAVVQCQTTQIDAGLALGITIQRLVKGNDSASFIFKTFSIPEHQLDLRLFDVDISIEIREQKKGQKAGEAECWVLLLHNDLKPERVMIDSKRLLRRLESTTKKMPPEWFSYRNFACELPSDGNIQYINRTLVLNLIGGYTWRFTGAFTKQSFLKGLRLQDDSEDNSQDTAPQLVGNVELPKTARGKKASKLLQKKIRRSQRVSQKFAGSIKSPEPPQPEPPEKEWEINGLLERKVTDEQTYYLVKWSGDWEPSWEPAGNCSEGAIAEWNKKNETASLRESLEGSSTSSESSSGPSAAPPQRRRGKGIGRGQGRGRSRGRGRGQ